MGTEELAKKFVEITENLDSDAIKNATNEELMEYLFMVEKLKKKLEKAVKLEGDK